MSAAGRALPEHVPQQGTQLYTEKAPNSRDSLLRLNLPTHKTLSQLLRPYCLQVWQGLWIGYCIHPVTTYGQVQGYVYTYIYIYPFYKDSPTATEWEQYATFSPEHTPADGVSESFTGCRLRPATTHSESIKRVILRPSYTYKCQVVGAVFKL